MIQICNTCFKELVRVRGVKKTNGYYYVDERHRLWQGHRCPDCVANEVRSTKSLRKRRCRGCQKSLPPERYFMHEACGFQGEYHDWAADYRHHVVP